MMNVSLLETARRSAANAMVCSPTGVCCVILQEAVCED
jgi:hypothetical protein